MNSEFYNNLIEILTSGNVVYSTVDIIRVSHELGIINKTEYTNLMRTIYWDRT